MSQYNTSNLQSTFSDTFARYQKWQARHSDSDLSAVDYLKIYNKAGAKQMASLWENSLESGGDGTKGNSISFDRYFQQGENNNEVLFQTQNGEVIKMDFNSGAVNVLSESDVASMYNVATDAYDVMDFDNGSMQMKEYQFTGLEDGEADVTNFADNHYSVEELDMAKGQDNIKSIVKDYSKDHGGIDSLKQVFGSESGKSSNVIYSSDGKSMCVVQNNKAYVGKLDEKGNYTITEVTTDNVGDYTTVDASKTIKSLSFSISDNKQLAIDIQYVTASGSTEDSKSTTGGWGDPHFKNNGKTAFDLQGAGGGSTGNYTLLKNDDVTWTADFEKYQSGTDGSTVMGSQHLTLHTAAGDVQVDYDHTGAYTVTKDGKSIDNPQDYGVNITKSGSNVNVNYNGRNITFSGYNVDTDAIKAGDKGILTQTAQAANGIDTTDYNQIMVQSSSSAISAAVLLVNGDSNYVNDVAKGFVDTVNKWGASSAGTVMSGASSNLASKPNYDYTVSPNDVKGTTAEKAEIFARLAYAALNDKTCSSSVKQQVVANWLTLSSQSMIADMSSNKNNSIAADFTSGHGYSASQWNEYSGTVAFATAADVNKDGTEDKALDVDNDGYTDGFDINQDGVLQDSEKTKLDLGTLFKSSDSGLFEF